MIAPNLRHLGIGGSDVGAIFGCDESRDAFSLCAEKKGSLPRPAPTPEMRLGKNLERGIVGYYSEVTGREIEWCDETQRHPDRPLMVFTPDALCKHERRGVEAKTVNSYQRRKWGDTADEIPENFQLQCWYYIAATDFDVWDLVAPIGGDLPHIYTLERDREAERVILARVEEFYKRYLVGDERPPIGRSADADRWLQQAFPKHKRPDLRAATPEEVALLTEYADVRISQRELADWRAELENQIKLAIADREGLTWSDGIFTWRKTKDTVTDWQSMAIALLTHYVKDPKARQDLEAQYTRPKPGSRRIRFEHDEEQEDVA